MPIKAVIFIRGNIIRLKAQMQVFNRCGVCKSSFRSFFSECYSTSQLFVGGLSYDTNETILKKAFEEYGEILEVKVICHHQSGKSKGFGFVKYTATTNADKAMKEMDGKLLDGWNIRVRHAYRGGTKLIQESTEETHNASSNNTNAT